MRVHQLCAFMVVVNAPLLTAQAPPSVVELEPQATITAVDRQDISRLLEASSKPAWLWTIRRGQAGGIWLVQTFAGPDVERSNLRRGTATMIRGELSSADVAARIVAGPKSWVTGRTGSYAQVAMPNRTFQDIRGPNDPNLPFLNSTTLTDDELVSLVTFIRSSPESPSVDFNNWTPGRISKFGAMVTRVRGDLPIDVVRIDSDSPTPLRLPPPAAFAVQIRLSPTSFQTARLSHMGSAWTLIEITGAVQ